MKIIDLEHTPTIEAKMEGAKKVLKQVPLSRADGAPNFSFRVFTIEPGGYTPHHAHPQEHLNFIINGSGVIVGEGGKERQVKEGDFIMILPDELHQYRNTSTEDALVFICAVNTEYE